jgi:(2R)-ethylmalonyl-CoA mutase
VPVHRRVEEYVERTGHRPRILVGKPGLDGHSNGAEVIALAARDAGFEVLYAGIRLTPADIVQTAVQESADVIGISVLSGSHVELAGEILDGLRALGAGDIPLLVGGIIPERDVQILEKLGVRDVFTPSDFDLVGVIGRLLDAVEIAD